MVRFIMNDLRESGLNPLADLHSNMVRFIIISREAERRGSPQIYIPIWLDLLYAGYFLYLQNVYNLHSNMVRFIINRGNKTSIKQIAFTFQYG